MSARDLLHRLVDDLDESDVSLVASLAEADNDPDSSGRIEELLGRIPPRSERRRRSLALVALVLLVEPTTGHGGDRTAMRQQNVANALGSLRAERLEPSPEAMHDARAYESGALTAREFYAATLARSRRAASR